MKVLPRCNLHLIQLQQSGTQLIEPRAHLASEMRRRRRSHRQRSRASLPTSSEVECMEITCKPHTRTSQRQTYLHMSARVDESSWRRRDGSGREKKYDFNIKGLRKGSEVNGLVNPPNLRRAVAIAKV